MKRLSLVLNVVKGWPFLADACPPSMNQCHCPYVHEYSVGILSSLVFTGLRVTPKCVNMLTEQNTCSGVERVNVV